MLCRAGTLRACLLGEACVWESVSGLCSHIMLWGTPISLRAQPTLPWKGRLFGSAFPSPRYPALLSMAPQGKRKAAQKWDIQSVSPSEATVWDQGKVCGLLHAGLASALRLMVPSKPSGSAWLSFSSRGHSWLHPTRPCGLLLLGKAELETSNRLSGVA